MLLLTDNFKDFIFVIINFIDICLHLWTVSVECFNGTNFGNCQEMGTGVN